MRIEALGDSALMISDVSTPPAALAKELERLSGCKDAVASYETVGVYFEPGAISPSDVESFILSLPPLDESSSGKLHLMPVCYELGPDLFEVAATLGIGAEELISAHLLVEYECFAVGFTPGFPYLGYLVDAISGTPRKIEPRVRVEPGSVGITGRQTGIYPSTVPGGWNLIGRTPLQIVDMKDGYFPISAGDRVRFTRIDSAEFARLEGSRL